MEKVTGIGGIFFKAKDPAALRAWYQEHLGVAIEEYGAATFTWGGKDSEAGMTVWSAFEEKGAHFEAPLMINYLVKDLDAMLAQLRAKGAKVDEKTMSESYGKFAWAYDCEGNKFELWQPL